jgi:hypothetical protein
MPHVGPLQVLELPYTQVQYYLAHTPIASTCPLHASTRQAVPSGKTRDATTSQPTPSPRAKVLICTRLHVVPTLAKHHTERDFGGQTTLREPPFPRTCRWKLAPAEVLKLSQRPDSHANGTADPVAVLCTDTASVLFGHGFSTTHRIPASLKMATGELTPVAPREALTRKAPLARRVENAYHERVPVRYAVQHMWVFSLAHRW